MATETVKPAEKKAEETVSPKALLDNLSRVERTTGGSGAVPLTPKAMMLDASDVAAKHPDLHLRWVNIKDPQRAAVKLMEGYRRLTSEEGGRHLGDELALFGIDRKQWDQMQERQKETNRQRLDAYKGEVERMAEAVAKQLRDEHGLKVDSRRIFVNESD